MAPATALAVNMHCYWTGVAADLARLGDDSCRWILEKAGEGEIFAALHGEAGNDMPLLLAVATAARVEGGWEISGHKIFGSLSPVWTYGGFHAMDTSDPANPKVVHGFLPRGSAGCQIVETWDTIGMRATQSHDTVLDKAFCPDELVPVVCPAGFAGAGPFHASIFAWAEDTGRERHPRDTRTPAVQVRGALRKLVEVPHDEVTGRRLHLTLAVVLIRAHHLYPLRSVGWLDGPMVDVFAFGHEPARPDR